MFDYWWDMIVFTYISWWYSLIVISFMYEWFHIIRVHDMNWGNLIMCVWVQLSCWDLLRIILIDNFLSELHHNNIIKFFWLSHVHHLLKIQYVVPNCVSYNCFTLIMLGIIIWIKDIETKEKRPQFACVVWTSSIKQEMLACFSNFTLCHCFICLLVGLFNHLHYYL